MPSPNQPSLYFVHIAKTAGTSFKLILHHYFPEHLIAKNVTEADFIKNRSIANEGNYLLYYGHCNHDFHKLLPGTNKIITFLRDPVQRVISNFEHIQRTPTHFLYDELMKHGNDIQAFVNEPVFQNTSANHQTRKLGVSLDNKLEEIINAPELSDEEKCRAWWAHFDDSELTDDELNRAQKRLQQMLFFGVVEKFYESLELFSRTLNAPTPQEAPFANAASPQDHQQREERYSENDLEAIRQANQLDTRLYNFAYTQFNKRYQRFVQ